MFKIQPVDRKQMATIQFVIDQKTKPIGSLGSLEAIAKHLALVLSHDNKTIDPLNPIMLIFAGDHGIAAENISIAPSEVTQQMVMNFLNGGAAINCFCRTNNLPIEVVDAGILLPIEDKRLNQQSLGRGTANFIDQAAMSKEQVINGLVQGKKIADKNIDSHFNLFAFGEMGIGNTSSAAAIQSMISNINIEECVGRGTGIDNDVFERKKMVLKRAVSFHRNNLGDYSSDPMAIMAAVGGFEIVQMVGAMLAVADKQKLILVDGYIATAAALLACKLYPNSRDYMIFCHRSNEKAHQKMLDELDATPLLDLGLRLGEGTGAALALPLITAAASFYNDMASFESAGVTTV